MEEIKTENAKTQKTKNWSRGERSTRTGTATGTQETAETQDENEPTASKGNS